jgi:hypothetical protein
MKYVGIEVETIQSAANAPNPIGFVVALQDLSGIVDEHSKTVPLHLLLC